MNEKKICVLENKKQTCKCTRNRKRVNCKTLKLIPKMPKLKFPAFLNFLQPSTRGNKKGTHHHHVGGSKRKRSGSKRSGGKRSGGIFGSGFFFSAACKKKGKTIKCNNMIGW